MTSATHRCGQAWRRRAKTQGIRGSRPAQPQQRPLCGCLCPLLLHLQVPRPSPPSNTAPPPKQPPLEKARTLSATAHRVGVARKLLHFPRDLQHPLQVLDGRLVLALRGLKVLPQRWLSLLIAAKCGSEKMIDAGRGRLSGSDSADWRCGRRNRQGAQRLGGRPAAGRGGVRVQHEGRTCSRAEAARPRMARRSWTCSLGKRCSGLVVPRGQQPQQ
jgi:hypothetical protein